MVKDSTCSPYKNVYSSTELVSLILDGNATVDGKYIVLSFVVFESIELLGHLESELSCRSKHHTLNLASP